MATDRDGLSPARGHPVGRGTSSRRLIVLGAGPSGLSTAWKLAEQGVAVEVLEAEDRVGGLSATLRLEGHDLDIGPHSFFSDDPDMVRIVQQLYDGGLPPLRRQARLFHEGRYLDYPPTVTTILRQMTPARALAAFASFAKGRLFSRNGNPEREETVEDWAIRNFGRHLYRTFFRPYTEQFWNLPCTELSACTIPEATRTSFLNALRVLLRRPRNPVGPSVIEREAQSMYYPPRGYGDICERMASRLRQSGGQVHPGCRATRVIFTSGHDLEVEYVRAGRTERVPGSHVVSTLPLPALVRMLDPPLPPAAQQAAAQLHYRALVVLGLATETPVGLDCGYLYVLDRPYNRVTDMNRFTATTRADGGNLILVEMPCLEGSETWHAGRQALFERCIGPLEQDGILQRRDVRAVRVARAPCAYPIFRLGFAAHLDRVLNAIRTRERLFTLGRGGRFSYQDLDQCVRQGFALADELAPILGKREKRPRRTGKETD